MPAVSSQGAVTYGILAVGLVAAFASQAWPWSLRTMILLALAVILGAILFLVFITASH